MTPAELSAAAERLTGLQWDRGGHRRLSIMLGLPGKAARPWFDNVTTAGRATIPDRYVKIIEQLLAKKDQEAMTTIEPRSYVHGSNIDDLLDKTQEPQQVYEAIKAGSRNARTAANDLAIRLWQIDQALVNLSRTAAVIGVGANLLNQTLRAERDEIVVRLRSMGPKEFVDAA